MTGVRLDRFLASTAVVLLLSAGAGGAFAEPMTDAAISAAVPMPEPANLPPPTAADVGAAAPSTEPAAETAVAKPTITKPTAAATPATAPDVTGTAGQDTATAPAATPAQQTLATADAAVADQLRELTNGKFDRVFGGKKDRITIDAFYSGRDYAPLWLTDGKANARATSAIAYLGHVDADGLDPADYPVPDFTAMTDPAALADAEMKLTASVLTYAHHAAVGRVHWSRISADISYTVPAPEPADVLANLVEAKDVGAALAAYEPQTPGYIALRAKLAEIRGGKVDPTKPPIPNGPAPKIGAQDDRVPQLRERFGVSGDGNTYDKPLADAVKKFQQEHELKATGSLTAQTIEALNGRRPDRPTDIILANLERWRWMPHDLGNTYVIVNLPEYTLRVMHDGKELWKTRIVDGKPTMATPIMQAEMKYITINPTWNVPPSIVHNEYLPALAQDPQAMERIGLKVSHNPDGSIHISQPPGDRNALGRIRFNFPNKFLVYQHDTPDKYMFAFDKRAFSHGCMRVQDPAKYAEVLLSLVRPGEGYTEERIKRMFGPNETDIQFPTFMPVNLTYQTAYVDDDGKLQFREDIYGRDRALLAWLKGDERKVADIAVEHRENLRARQIAALPDQPSFWGGGGPSYNGSGTYSSAGAPRPPRGVAGGGDGQGFFSRLFGSSGGSPAYSSTQRAAPRKQHVNSRRADVH